MPDNLYKRGNVWWCRIQVRGRDVRRSLRTTSLVEARKRREALIKDAAHFRFKGETRHTWKEAVVEWAKAASIKDGTRKRYLVSLKQLRPILDKLYIDEINRGTISKIARRSGVSNATRRRDMTAVSVVLSWCVAHNWREDNPARDWDRKIIPEKRDPIVLPSGHDIDATVAEAPGMFASMIRLAQYTGMRQEECAGLERRQVNVRRAAIDLTKTKTNTPRSVPMDSRAVGTITGTVPYVGKPWVFWHGEGERYMNVSSRFALLNRRAGEKARKDKRPEVRRFRFHDLRHWYAVDYLRRGGSIYDLQQILGHSSIKTTEIYLKYLTPDEQRRAKRTGTLAGTVATVYPGDDADSGLE